MNYSIEQVTTDFLIIGGGVAGLRAAVELARNGDVLVVTKDAPSESSTEYAQGGVAVALSDEDEIAIHVEDTIRAGDGLCNRKAVATLVEEGPMRIRELIVWGVEFDQEGSRLAFTREAAHSKHRVLHAQGDSTGHEILRVLIDKVRVSKRTTKIDFAFTQELIVERGRCVGAVVVRQNERRLFIISARAVLLATGGAGRLFERTTNPPVATGDGMAMAWRAGAQLMDLEFIQFHPTALYRHDAPQFLLSEAMRGEGGMLRNIHGLRFMERYHPARELAPRDVVTRAIHDEMTATGADHVYLDVTHLSAEYVRKRFPRIYQTCLSYGVDITEAPIPVSPAAHYIMGGVATDLWGATTIPGLFAAGETACTGVHGANRLASNSLLEGLVFGERAGLGAARYASKQDRPGQPPKRVRSAVERLPTDVFTASDVDYVRTSLRKTMWENVGIIRNRKGLTTAIKKLREWDRIVKHPPLDRSVLELKNMITLSLLIARSALLREGSVGAHYRSDYPKKGTGWNKRIILRR
jgi:L-aspartate oxidase